MTRMSLRPPSRPAAATRSLPVCVVPPDHFEAITHDGVLEAELQGSVAVCLYDAVEESGGLVHLRIMPPTASGGEDTLADVLLLDACLKQLRESTPTARHWQARVVAHLGSDGSLLPDATLMTEAIGHFCEMGRVRVIDAPPERGIALRLQFRPSMGQHRLVY